jgi:hypothetical protein
MALAQVQYTQSAAGNRNFTVPFPYISRDHVKVSVNGNPVAFTWTNNATVQLATAPAVGAVIDVRRETERVNLLVDFQDASTITERELDLSAQQAFYLAQEAFDATGGTLSVSPDGSYSAAGRRIRDVGTPTQPGDAANRQWVINQFQSGVDAGVAKAAAEAARDKAQQWADAARNTQVEPNRFSARHHALNAADSASAAAASAASIVADELLASQKADEAAASASAAQTARTGAEAARNAAQTAQAAAETARNTAQSAATTATGARDTTLAYRDQTLTYRDTANSHRVNAETARNEALNFRNTASDHATTANNAANTALSHRNTANDHRLNAAASATSAANSATEANTHRQAAANSAAEAAGYAAGVNLPSAAGNGGKLLRQKADGSGLEYFASPGSGGGLDADKVDGYDADQLVKADATSAFIHAKSFGLAITSGRSGTTGGWARHLSLANSPASSNTGAFGCLGSAESITYCFISADKSDATHYSSSSALRVYPDKVTFGGNRVLDAGGFDLLWSGSVGTANVVLTLAKPVAVGDLIVIRHNDSNQFTGVGFVTRLGGSGTHNFTVTFGVGGGTTLYVNSAGTEVTTRSYTSGYGISAIYRVKLGS